MFIGNEPPLLMLYNNYLELILHLIMLTVVIIVNVIFMGAVGCQSAGMLELVGFMINTSVGCLVVFLWP